MQLTKELVPYVNDGDSHTKLMNVHHSTDLRAIVTVGYMIEHAKQQENESN